MDKKNGTAGGGDTPLECKHFLVGDALLNRIVQLTRDASGPFKRRDFVAPLVAYCLNDNYRCNCKIIPIAPKALNLFPVRVKCLRQWT
jgi:hypothetical protein